MSVKEFTKEADAESYIDWLANNPKGFVVNTPSSINSNDMVLHTSICKSIKKKKGKSILTKYIKICSNSTNELLDWIERHDGSGFTSVSCHCKPKVYCQSIDFEEFWSWLKQKTNYEFSTVKQKLSFTIDIDKNERVNITPLSSKTNRSMAKKSVQNFTEQYNEIRSISPSDYDGHNNSYLTSLIFAHNSENKPNNDKGVDVSFKKIHKEDVLKTIKIRQGQSEFRQILLEEFNYCCAITGCLIERVLEAAHIVPHREETNYHASNGLLLRADIHTLYDLDLLKINVNGNVIIEPELINDKNYFSLLEGKSIALKLLTPQRKVYLKQRFSSRS